MDNELIEAIAWAKAEVKKCQQQGYLEAAINFTHLAKAAESLQPTGDRAELIERLKAGQDLLRLFVSSWNPRQSGKTSAGQLIVDINAAITAIRQQPDSSDSERTDTPPFRHMRAILSLLGIAAPESDECLYSSSSWLNAKRTLESLFANQQPQPASKELVERLIHKHRKQARDCSGMMYVIPVGTIPKIIQALSTSEPVDSEPVWCVVDNDGAIKANGPCKHWAENIANNWNSDEHPTVYTVQPFYRGKA